MLKMTAALCFAFLLTLACRADVSSPTPSSDEEAKQCLMQKKHEVSKSHVVHDKQHSHTEVHTEDEKPEVFSALETGSGPAYGSPLSLQELLPPPVLALAYQVFQTEGAIRGAVDNSVQKEITHAGVQMTLRMNKYDDATKRLGEEGTWFSYDLDSLGDVRNNSNDMLNMIDLGGNYGVVTIAAMKKYPNHLRVLTVEPMPTTFFFLKWNLHLNGIPEIDEAALSAKEKTSGVLVLNSGSADVAGESLSFCSYPDSSMNSKVCDCKVGDTGCISVPSTSVDTLAGMFGTEQIAMVKMDCEGCEFKSLPALAKISNRVHRLAGELHIPDEGIEKLACQWDQGRLMSKCQHPKKDPNSVECGVQLSCAE